MSTQSDTPRRALALDALRGLAILGMILSARIPYGWTEGVQWLPGWMYHGQEGPNPEWFGPHPAGFTWVDLVFPAFLFAMGAAFPLALSRRLERRASGLSIGAWILQRFVLLVFFAIYLQHTIPYVMGDSAADHWVGLLAFLILFPIFTRFPRSWSSPLILGLRVAGLASACGLLAVIRYPDGGGFDLYRRDMIILVLANVALVGSALWLLGSRGKGWRVLAYGLGLALGVLGHCSMNQPTHVTLGLGEALSRLNAHPLSWMTQLLLFKYMLTVVPGMIAGDLLLAWMRSPHEERPTAQWFGGRLWVLVWVTLGLVVFAHIGLKARWVIATPVGLAVACAAGFALVRSPRTSTERFLARLWLWGGIWLAIGMALEPLEGGIKKTPSTLSYYTVSAGLSIFLLVLFTAVIDVLGHRRPMGLLITNGQNPMLAYAGIRGVLGPFYRLTGIDALITNPIFRFSAWLGALWGLIKSLSLAALVHILTRRKILWRS
ncbi:DUF5009 domain-containing protein [Candidatus Sumerlaeota bacterium]|nr:DUF5009 domain-containing protein [Candidatus Sumerlaeota bacterium]